jgi:pimeloyl-ACP methyl ester carboxylesterase
VALADGTRLWTTTTGSGPPVVLLHGGPGLWCYLADVAELLAADHAVVRLDQRGCGRSTGAEGPFTLAGAVDDLEQLRQSLGIERWGLVGHSWGAELALRYLSAVLPAVEAPVTVVAGADDPRPWASTDHLVATLPRARRHVLGGAGHAPWVERPQDVQHLLRRALRGGDTDPPAQTHHW